MTAPSPDLALEAQIDQWRNYLRHRQAIHAVDVAELEDHLREQVAGLRSAGLAADEAFLVAVKRMGDLDALSREFAREHSERLWKQLVIVPAADRDDGTRVRTDALVAFAAAVGAAALAKLPVLFGIDLDTHESFYLRHAPFFVLPLLTAYFAWKRRLDLATTRWLAVGFLVALLVVNLQRVVAGGDVEVLMVLHLPIALWLLVGIAYAGGRWSTSEGRMDFVRFSGELFIYFVLIALGGGVLMAFTAMIFKSVGVDVEPVFERWILPCGPAGAVLVAAWLVEAKQSVVENMAPVLTRLFTPMFAVTLLVFLGTLVVTGRGIRIERDMLIGFDLLLALVLGLVLYAVSARDPQAPPGLFDRVQVVLLVAALVTDIIALSAIAARIGEFGFTPNRVAALGENVVLLVNLAWSALLYVRFLRGRGTFAALERWQTTYLPVYAGWAAFVVLVFPLVFRPSR
ncbi:MAG: permease prefix domain 1-containing protein [Gemmatimonadaceae bacterium]|jgi:hypothetical protein|nr:permease prefix domain 1-containing protein [Gemmatimonadaceae bacterium]